MIKRKEWNIILVMVLLGLIAILLFYKIVFTSPWLIYIGSVEFPMTGLLFFILTGVFVHTTNSLCFKANPNSISKLTFRGFIMFFLMESTYVLINYLVFKRGADYSELKPYIARGLMILMGFLLSMASANYVVKKRIISAMSIIILGLIGLGIFYSVLSYVFNLSI